MKELADKLGFSFLAEPWLPQMLIAIVATVAINLVAEFLLRHAARATAKTATPWDEALVRSAGKPILVAIWLVGLAFAAAIVRKHTEAPIFDFVAPTRDIGVMTCLAWFLLRFIGNVSRNIVAARKAKGEDVDQTTIDAMSKLARLTVLITAVLMAMQTLGFSITEGLIRSPADMLAIACVPHERGMEMQATDQLTRYLIVAGNEIEAPRLGYALIRVVSENGTIIREYTLLDNSLDPLSLGVFQGTWMPTAYLHLTPHGQQN